MLLEPLIDLSLIEAQIKKHLKTETPDPLTYGVVIYTDGGCKGRDAGYGVHGMIHCNTPVKVGCGVTGYSATDYGYIQNNSLTQGIEHVDMFTGVTVKSQSVSIVQPFVYFDGSGSIMDSTNNVGETLAFIRSLEVIERLYQELGIQSVHFCIDSKYVINNVLTRFDIINNNWCNKSGAVIANRDYWETAFSKLEALGQFGIKWTIQWVQGHSDNFGNIQADRLATKGRTAAANDYQYDKFKFMPAQGRWGASGVDTRSNPGMYFMVDNRWYHDPSMDWLERNDELSPVFMGTHEAHTHAGQPNASDCYVVALLINPPRHLQRIANIADRLNRVENGFEVRSGFSGAVNTILKPEFEDQIMEDGDGFVVVNQSTKMAVTYEGKEILEGFNPPLLSLILFEKLNNQYDILNRVVGDCPMPGDCLTDITNQVFSIDLNSKNKNVWKVIAPNEASMKVNVGISKPDSNHVYQTSTEEITLSYGITAPRYRVYGGIKDHEPQVLVLTTYEPVAGFRYHTIVKLKTGEWCIWSNPSANLQLF